MKFSNRHAVWIIGVVILAVGAAIFSAGVRAQEEGWQIPRRRERQSGGE